MIIRSQNTTPDVFTLKMFYVLNCIIIFCVKVPKSDEEYDLRVPRDMAYIFSGAYVPLSCKLIEQVRFIYSTGPDTDLYSV